MTVAPVLGIRLNNPLNIRRGLEWRGLAPVQSHAQFCEFVEPIYGIRAGARILFTYYRDHGIRTIEDIVSRWAPPEENDTEAYIESIVKQTGYARDMLMAFTGPSTITVLLRAMIRQEVGSMPYLDAVVEDGASLAVTVTYDA
jgi:hypothetical protein